MALIIEGMEMPKACWQFRYGEESYVCPLYESCKKKIPYDMDFRPSACPIKGEIPDKHGNLKDENKILERIDEAISYEVGRFTPFSNPPNSVVLENARRLEALRWLKRIIKDVPTVVESKE